MLKPVALQLYSVREAAGKDLPGTLKIVADIGYPYAELAGMHGKTPAEFKKLLDDVGLKVCSSHCAVFDPAKRAQTEDEARTMGYTHLVSGFGPDDFKTEDAIKAAADKVNAAVDCFGPKGFSISIHNHYWEFAGPNKGDLLYKLAPKACPQLDVYWIKVGGADPAKVVKRYAKRCKLLHLKDGAATMEQKHPMTAVGKGTVDIPAVIKAAEKSIVEFLIVELDDCATDMIEAVRDSYTYLTSKGLAQGKK
ncbi:MAG: sugar phosphate isomerase/epimerase [Planctomycetota bacterium]|nr:sugar phosphate isomerase/epimerase [Planctomycetota bacterium]